MAKTIAMSADFVNEAFDLIGKLEPYEPFASSIQEHRSQIIAGLHIFAARRLIDSDQPGEALAHFGDAARYSPGGCRPSLVQSRAGNWRRSRGRSGFSAIPNAPSPYTASGPHFESW